MLKTPEQFLEDLRSIKREVYYLGEKVENPVDHPVFRPAINSVMMTYALAQDPAYEDVMTCTSSLTGEKINRFTNIHSSRDDLLKKVKMQRLVGQKTCACFQRCAMMDASNSVFSWTYEIDKKYGTEYHKGFVEFMKYVQSNDIHMHLAVTDPKGDRSKRPSAQDDPDLHLHVVERREDGVVVRGAKCHFTGAVSGTHVLVMPTTSLRPGEEDYAIGFTIRMDAPGLKMIIGRQSCDLRKFSDSEIDVGNSEFGGLESLLIFDDVFVPNESIFLNGQTEFAGPMVDAFACYHRNSYGGCKPGEGDVFIGACALMADYLGLSKTSHMKDKLIDMTRLNETLWCCGIASASEGYQVEAGNWMVDPLLANVCKLNVTMFPYDICRMGEEMVGGLMVTAPSEADLKNPETARFIEKYLVGANGVSAENKLRLLRLIENMTLGTGAVGYKPESMHGAGSPAAQKLNLGRLGGFEVKKEMAKKIAHIKD